MTQVTPDEVAHLAKLARLNLSPEEITNLAEELPKIVEFVEELQSVKLDADIASRGAVEAGSLRADKVSSDSLTLEQLEKLAPSFDQNQVVVPAVFGEEPDA